MQVTAQSPVCAFPIAHNHSAVATVRRSLVAMDEFQEETAQSLPSLLEDPATAPSATAGDKEFYQSLSIVEKLHFQLRRSGDLGGKYGILP